MNRSRILIADDHAVVVEGLRRILDRPEFRVVGVAKDGRAMVKEAAESLPDVIITDVAMPMLNGIDATREIHRHNSEAKIIFLTMHSDVAYARAALAAGACAYVLKSAAGEELVEAIQCVLRGQQYVSRSIAKSVEQARETGNGPGTIDSLTHRQREILQLLAEGKQVKEIAALLNLSPKTVEFHKYRMMDALGLRTIVDLARYAQKRGMVE